MYDLDDKVAIITGTSNKRGMGRGIALRLAQEHVHMVVSDKHKNSRDFDPWDQEEGWRGIESLAEEIRALGSKALAIDADITNPNEVNAVVGKALDQFGKVDILVNNAGIIARDIGSIPIVDLAIESWNKALAVNMTGTFLMCKVVVKHMIERGQGGKIINISSIAGKRAMPGRSAYSSSKAGVVGFTQTLALEVGKYNINVNAICPGIINTWGTRGKEIWEAMSKGMSEEEAVAKVYSAAYDLQQIPLGRPGRVQDIANVVTFLCSNQSDYMTGQAINVTGGWLFER